MPTYLYEDTKTGEQFEAVQGIKDPPYTHRMTSGELVVRTEHSLPCSKAHPLKRLIAGAPGFQLIAGDSGGWASQGYSKPEHARQAEQTLGRKLHKPV